MANELWVPQHLRKAKVATKIVFYKYKISDTSFRIEVGAPEEYPAPKGAEKIVCESAAEVEKYSKIMSEQDTSDLAMTEEEREIKEGPMRDYARKELIHLRDNARNQMNRDFCQMALDKMDADDKKRKEKRESFMHIEAFEHGK